MIVYIDHQLRKGSTLGLIYGTIDPESGYSSKLDTSPKLFTVGMYAGFIFCFIKSSQLNPLNHLCFLISLTPVLFKIFTIFQVAVSFRKISNK